MKAVLTLIAVLYFGANCMAQQAPGTTDQVHADTDKSPARTEVLQNVVKDGIPAEAEIARLYRFKNSRIIKELSFSTKKNKAKLA